MAKKSIDWSLYSFNNPHIADKRRWRIGQWRRERHTAYWKESGKTVSMPYARWLWVKYKGDIPVGYYIHHINGNSMDDRICNLSCVSPTEHCRLHKGIAKNDRRSLPYG